jgi:hypothetical protein
MDNAFATPIDQVLAKFQVDADAGLSNDQVNELRKKHGSNGESPLFAPSRCCPGVF